MNNSKQRLFTLALAAAAFAFPAFAQTAGSHEDRDDLTPKEQIRAQKALAPVSDFSKAEPFEAMAGGGATSRKHVTPDVFSHPSPNLSFAEREQFFLGNGLFRKLWVSSPSSTQASDGLGPLFNARSCQGCHLKDGRAHPPEPGEEPVGLFLRLSVPPLNEAEREELNSGRKLVLPEPTYGGQLQTFAVPGLKAEAQMSVTYKDLPVTLDDGTVVTLRAPSYDVTELANGPMRDDVMISPRIAPPMIGLGLLEAIHESDILAKADPDDADKDGVSGRASYVADPKTGALTLGRFGWKASAPNVRAQSAAAFSGDIGISSPEHPDNYGDCTQSQTDCRAMPHGEQPRLGPSEAPDPVLALVDFYSRNLAVPIRRDVDDPTVLRGKKVFYDRGCASCHTPKYVTRKDADIKAHRFQLIWPYTDMLLHDMGEGLADHRPAGMATGSEWRTPPLWGVGLTSEIGGKESYLHDGRARNLTEAILWHGGEAQSARDAFAASNKQDRDALIRFLESL